MTNPHPTKADSRAAEKLRQQVAKSYGSLARGVLEADGSADCECTPQADPMSAGLYSQHQSAELPDTAMVASLGCGNPTAMIQLTEGQIVLDLGSGGGIDVLLSARRVGPSGKAYGLDMTDEMLELARTNQAKAGVDNVEFLRGTIERVPLPDNSVDVVISNCVINLSADKDAVFAEAFRVLSPGGRFAVSDIVIRGELDPEIRHNIEAWIGCVAGALKEAEYRSGLERAGFVDVEIESTREYTLDDAREFLEASGVAPATAESAGGQVISAFVRATKP